MSLIISLLKIKPVKQCIKASLKLKLTGLWWYNSLSFNLFIFSFPLRLFVCLFPWFWLLSFLRRYVHLLFPNASPFLSFQVLLVVHHAFVLFLIFFFLHLYGKFFTLFIFVVRLSIDSFELQMFVCSVSHWVSGLSTLFYLCGWLPGSRWVHFPPRGLGSGELMLCDHFTEQFDPLFSVCCDGHTLDLCFLEAVLSPFSHSVSSTKDFSLTLQSDHEPIYPLAFCCLLSGCMEREYCTFSIT